MHAAAHQRWSRSCPSSVAAERSTPRRAPPPASDHRWCRTPGGRGSDHRHPRGPPPWRTVLFNARYRARPAVVTLRSSRCSRPSRRVRRGAPRRAAHAAAATANVAAAHRDAAPRGSVCLSRRHATRCGRDAPCKATEVVGGGGACEALRVPPRAHCHREARPEGVVAVAVVVVAWPTGEAPPAALNPDPPPLPPCAVLLQPTLELLRPASWACRRGREPCCRGFAGPTRIGGPLAASAAVATPRW